MTNYKEQITMLLKVKSGIKFRHANNSQESIYLKRQKLVVVEWLKQ
jgi:hypothetical protein